jgi:hypothetical protein
MTCTVCKGTGKNKTTVTDVGVGTTEQFEMDCIWCDGTGQMTQEQFEDHRFYTNMWCRCGNPSKDFTFYDDGEHQDIHKHHYRCFDCSKVLQIG